MKKRAFIFLAEGFEEIEAISSIDLLRRAGIDTQIIAMDENLEVLGANGIKLKADTSITNVEKEEVDALVLPGGLPGADNLYASSALQTMLLKQNERKALIAAICASPAVVLGTLGLLKGKNATCYPSFEDKMLEAKPSRLDVVKDEHIITGKGPALSIAFALAIIEALVGKEQRDTIAQGILFE